MTCIIAFVSQKGGVGKSTLSRALAREATIEGLKTKIADLDIQQSTTIDWHRRRLQFDIQPLVSVESFSTATQAISIANDYELLIIDGPARASKGTLDIARMANLVVQPTGASLDDLVPAIKLFHSLVKEGIPKPKLVFALVKIGTESEELETRNYIKEAGYEVLAGCLFEKPSYRQAQNSGYSVTETRYKALNERADELIQSLINQVGE
ncbi:ParA family protein [Arsenophonus nasoniae]|uniref:ParA family protein n=1 Tax=Arsenophonus nasoniae TaxID=638 RepID=A0AA95K1H5_9GAMM|nr:ParA family protein [Arsenophonus nasoniae]WGL95881.1 ParA family protein [Arsenophonus nasoniae]